MGCGYSRLSIGSKRKKNKHSSPPPDNNTEEEVSKQTTFGENKSDLSTNNKETKNGLLFDDGSGPAKERIASKTKPISGPLQPQLNISESQQNFFKMLDDKIANGKDYNPDEDDDRYEIAPKHINIIAKSGGEQINNNCNGYATIQNMNTKSAYLINNQNDSIQTNKGIQHSKGIQQIGSENDLKHSMQTDCTIPGRNGEGQTVLNDQRLNNERRSIERDFTKDVGSKQVRCSREREFDDDMQVDSNFEDKNWSELKCCSVSLTNPHSTATRKNHVNERTRANKETTPP